MVKLNPSYSLKKGEYSPYLEMKNLSTSTCNPVNWRYRKFTSGIKFKNGDALLARITPCLENGKTCYVRFLQQYDQIAWGSTEYIVMRSKPPYCNFIAYLIAKDKDFREFAISNMSGSSGRQRVQVDMIKNYKIPTPHINIIEKLNNILSPITKKLANNAIQVQNLENLRDTLLPKLISGAVRVAIK